MKISTSLGINWLFIFAPIVLILEHYHAAAPLIFFSAALTIIPIARLISTATEQVARYTGDAVGGLLNATFGNAPELIIAVVALNAGLHDIVLASLVGAVLANLLLASGVSFLVGGLKYQNQEYNSTSVRVYSSMMMIAVISLAVPSAFHAFIGHQGAFQHNEDALNISLSIILLISYLLYLVFMLKTHPYFFRSEKSAEVAEDNHSEHGDHWSLQRGVVSLVGASVLAAVFSEILVGSAEETGKALGMSAAFIGVILLAVIGGAAESISAISMAAKNKMDLSLGIALGSSIQIALFIAPVLVLLSLVIGPHQMNLSFSKALIVSLFLSVIISAMVSADGRSNWYKGVQLIIVYIIIGMMFYFVPVEFEATILK